MIGKTLAHYEITSQIGKGGMGEVYQAKDQKLGRDVAIKVLPEEFAKDADRVARFQREAKLLASLNHPNIAAIHGLEEADGTHFLVLELVEGDTLAGPIKGGPVPIEEALKLALQIAEALEAAHEKGVIHRDLKPANIKVTPDDKVKVLDFGLAKAFAGEQADLNLSNSPTLSVAATQQGVILGTAAYMSPEQARGKEVDKRADIWAFGVVFFEMLSGKQVFTGDTVSDTLASVLAREPEWKILPTNLHPRIRLLLERCLKKDPKNRYHDIADARVDIQEVLADPNRLLAMPGTTEVPQRKLRTILPWVAAAIVLTGVVIWLLKPIPPPEPKQVIYSDYELPENQQFGYLGAQAIAISPDGSLLAYSTPEGIYLRSMDEWTAELLDRTEGAMDLFFSPDGQRIGFRSADDKLKIIAVSGGAPKTLVNMNISYGFSWTADKRILMSGGPILQVMPEDGGEWEILFREPGHMLGFPQMLPDGESVLYTAAESISRSKIMVRSLGKEKSKELLPGNFARYVKTGHIVYGLGNDLYAVPFDPDTLKLVGSSMPIVEGVMKDMYAWQYSFSDSGTFAYIPGTSSSPDAYPLQIPVWVDFLGNEEDLSIEPDFYNILRISPNGTQVAFTVGGATDSKIWIWDSVLKNRRLLTPDIFGACPVWTADGKHIAFTSDSSEGAKIYLKAANGTGKAELLGTDYGRINIPFPCSWSLDGKVLLVMGFKMLDNNMSYDIGSLSIDGSGSYRPLLEEKYIETEPRLSPDGRWMAYTCNVSGRPEVYVSAYPVVESGDRSLVSASGGYSPLWSPDSRKLYYRNGDAVMEVTLISDPDLRLGKSREIFRRAYYFPQTYNYMPAVMNSWDIDPNGNRFLMIKSDQMEGEESESETPRKINIVTNWFEELKEKVPVD